MDSIQAEQKVVSCVSEKSKWWEGRRALDSRVEVRGDKGMMVKLTITSLIATWSSTCPLKVIGKENGTDFIF